MLCSFENFGFVLQDVSVDEAITHIYAQLSGVMELLAFHFLSLIECNAPDDCTDKNSTPFLQKPHRFHFVKQVNCMN